MSGFLERLVARSVGREPSIRPRLPSLFEGGKGGWIDVTDSGDPGPVGSPRPASVGSEPAGRFPQVPRGRQDIRAPGDPVAAIRSAVEVAVDGLKGPTGAERASPISSGPPAGGRSGGPASPERVRIRERATASVGGERRPAVATEPRLESPTNGMRPATAAPSLFLVPHEAVPSLMGSVRERRGRGDEDRGPSVQVRIGRVDVRAVVQSDSPPRPAPEPAGIRPLTLEEYARRREGPS